MLEQSRGQVLGMVLIKRYELLERLILAVSQLIPQQETEQDAE